jgi:hypothetical protein
LCCVLGHVTSAAGSASVAVPAAPLQLRPSLSLGDVGRPGEAYSDLVVARHTAAVGNESGLSAPGQVVDSLLPVVVSASSSTRFPASGAESAAHASKVQARLVEMSAVYLDLLVRESCREDRCWQGRLGAAGVPEAGRKGPGWEATPASKKLRPVSFELREHAGGRLLARADPPAPIVTSLRSLGLQVDAW